jgi:hydroxymethylglutaryl-CoA lyase
MIAQRVNIVDVGPRDGLQNEAQALSAATKIELVHRLQAAGLKDIEVTSFVSPKWVPQMADNTEVMAGIARQPGVRYSVLTPNMKGLEAALLSRPDEVVVFGAASETFSHKNINCSIAESLERFAPVVFEGAVPARAVGQVAQAMRAMGVQHVGVADTIGVGTPRQVQAAMEAALAHYDIDAVSGHFHDTYGQALANTLAALQMGVWQFDTSVAGLGGCPYAKGATGNVATEDVVFMLRGMGIDTGIDLDALIDAGVFISQALGRPPVSRVATAWLKKRAAP